MIDEFDVPTTTQKRWMKQGYCPWPRRNIVGHTKNPAYKCWENMIQRCTNSKFTGYENYGGRGISFHPSWLSFSTFIKDIGERPSSKHSLDRINNEGNYEPGNVRWATNMEQTYNQRKIHKGYIRKHGRKFQARLGDNFIGAYPSLEEAEQAIIDFKIKTGRPLAQRSEQ